MFIMLTGIPNTEYTSQRIMCKRYLCTFPIHLSKYLLIVLACAPQMTTSNDGPLSIKTDERGKSHLCFGKMKSTDLTKDAQRAYITMPQYAVRMKTKLIFFPSTLLDRRGRGVSKVEFCWIQIYTSIHVDKLKHFYVESIDTGGGGWPT